MQDGDPLRDEPTLLSGQRDLRRQAVLAAASGTRAPIAAGVRSRIGVFATAVLMVIAASLLGAFVWSWFNSDLQAAIRFEVRLAEDKPGPGLHEAKVSGSHRSVYLLDEVIVTNSDIAGARVFRDGGPSNYGISIEFNAAGAKKMRVATANHIGKPLAILFDGEVVMAPILHTPIEGSAEITGKFTKTEAETIARRVEMQ
jgi:hypothetical protein